MQHDPSKRFSLSSVKGAFNFVQISKKNYYYLSQKREIILFI
jgi:hypothetical protein